MKILRKIFWRKTSEISWNKKIPEITTTEILEFKKKNFGEFENLNNEIATPFNPKPKISNRNAARHR